MPEQQEKTLIGFIVNPVAGMGGSVGLKGTDGDMYARAVSLGARPVAPTRVAEFLGHIEGRDRIKWLVAPGPMGADHFARSNRVGEFEYAVLGEVHSRSSGEDTRRLARQMLRAGVELVVFSGGDGTARDIFDAIGVQLPVVAVPAGVKVYSSVFAVSPGAAAEMLGAFVEGAEVAEEEVLDIDEQAFREGRLEARSHGFLLIPQVARLLQGGKEASEVGGATAEEKRAIADAVVEEMESGTLYLLGPGTTVKSVADALRVEKTLLGVDAVCNRRLLASDLGEKGILALFKQYPHRKIIVTPLGGNGFIFGRGNRQFTPEVINLVGRRNILVIATRDKLRKLDCLRVDTDDQALNAQLAGYADVIVGFNHTKLIRVEC